MEGIKACHENNVRITRAPFCSESPYLLIAVSRAVVRAEPPLKSSQSPFRFPLISIDLPQFAAILEAEPRDGLQLLVRIFLKGASAAVLTMRCSLGLRANANSDIFFMKPKITKPLLS